MSDSLRHRDPAQSTDAPSNDPSNLESVVNALDAALAVNGEVRRLIMSCALGAAIVAVLPAMAWVYEIKLLIVLILNAFMIRGIGRRWAFARGQGPLTIATAALGLVGALAITAMAYMTVFSISLFVPVFRTWAEAAAYFALTLAVGRLANNYFLGARQIDRDRLARLLIARRQRGGDGANRVESDSGRRGWNRRRILLAGLGGSLVAEGAADYVRWRRTRAGSSVEAAGFDDPFEAAYVKEAAWQAEMRSMRAVREQATITPPRLPYDREVARRLIFACKAAVMQFRTGMVTASYEGDVMGFKSSPDAFGESETMGDFVAGARAFREFFGPGEQLATFVSEQEFFENYFNVLNPPPDGTIESPIQRIVRPVQDVLFEAVPKLVRREYRQSVFGGYVLATERASIIVFRGTQTTAEWLHNFRSQQRHFVAPRTGESYGWIHGGFLAMTEMIRPSPAEVASKLDPSKPCYIAGHSLGAALATICALKIALANPALSDQIRLYSFAGPRVGDPTFAERFSALLPDTYRVVNLADGVPLLPTSTMGRHFLHVGQEVSFVGKFGDLLLNHVVDAYQYALEQGVETAEEPAQLPVLTALERAGAGSAE
jgi:hypothetical protein